MLIDDNFRVVIDDTDEALLATIADGLALVPRPYQALGTALGLEEGDVIARLERMIAAGIIKRFGVIVRHHELGFAANAMVVWDIPDDDVGAFGAAIAAQPCVTLCYERPRRLPEWPYNLFAMIHGRDRDQVLEKVAELNTAIGLTYRRQDVLFSLRRFKQRGARYRRALAQTGALQPVAA
jgi:DNA-binding Lrp family transcriptional regulator